MPLPFLQATGLTKSYSERLAVDGLDLSCARGAIVGLLGPNGAGKTTTLRMLYGFVDPDAGQILYDGRSFFEERQSLKRRIGVCTQDDTLDYDFSVEQNLLIYASYFRPLVMNPAQRAAELLKRFGLDEYRTQSPRALSGGYVRRLLIARSIVHRPDVLFLDEPTTGLDPSARLDVWELINGMRAEGMAVILTTHYMDEAERLSDELVVLDTGKKIAEGKPDQVIGQVLGEHILVVPRDAPKRDEVKAWLQETGQQALAEVLGELRVPLDKRGLAELSARLPDGRWQVRRPTLDDLFIALSRNNGAARRLPSGADT